MDDANQTFLAVPSHPVPSICSGDIYVVEIVNERESCWCKLKFQSTTHLPVLKRENVDRAHIRASGACCSRCVYCRHGWWTTEIRMTVSLGKSRELDLGKSGAAYVSEWVFAFAFDLDEIVTGLRSLPELYLDSVFPPFSCFLFFSNLMCCDRTTAATWGFHVFVLTSPMKCDFLLSVSRSLEVTGCSCVTHATRNITADVWAFERYGMVCDVNNGYWFCKFSRRIGVSPALNGVRSFYRLSAAPWFEYVIYYKTHFSAYACVNQSRNDADSEGAVVVSYLHDHAPQGSNPLFSSNGGREGPAFPVAPAGGKIVKHDLVTYFCYRL